MELVPKHIALAFPSNVLWDVRLADMAIFSPENIYSPFHLFKFNSSVGIIFTLSLPRIFVLLLSIDNEAGELIDLLLLLFFSHTLRSLIRFLLNF